MTLSVRIKECKIWIVVEMERDENKHRVRWWYVEGIDEMEVMLKVMKMEEPAKE